MNPELLLRQACSDDPPVDLLDLLGDEFGATPEDPS